MDKRPIGIGLTTIAPYDQENRVLSMLTMGRASGDGFEPTPLFELWGATLIDGSRSEPMPDTVITVREGRIHEVRQGGPRGVGRVVDLRGTFIIPGLIDTHVHAEEAWAFAALLAMGVTTIRNPAATGGADAAADTAGLSVLSAGPPIDGPRSRLPVAIRVTSDEEMRREVRSQAAAGFDFIKLYNALPLELVRAGVSEAHRLGVRVIGDLVETSWTDAARAGIDFLCHAVPGHPSLLPAPVRASYGQEMRERRAHPYLRWLELVDLDGPQIAEMIEVLVEHHVAVDPTLVSIEAMFFAGDPSYHAQLESDRERAPTRTTGVRGAPALLGGELAKLRERARPAWHKVLTFVGAMHRAGVTVLAGSDAPRDWVEPGASLHRELALLVQTGMTPLEALRSATGEAAEALGVAADTGVVAPGRRADLIVLRDDPAAFIDKTTSIRGVMRSGRFVPLGDLPDWVIGTEPGPVSGRRRG